MSYGLRSCGNLVADGSGRDWHLFGDSQYRGGRRQAEFQRDLRRASPAWKTPPPNDVARDRARAKAPSAMQRLTRVHEAPINSPQTTLARSSSLPALKQQGQYSTTYKDLSQVQGFTPSLYGQPEKHKFQPCPAAFEEVVPKTPAKQAEADSEKWGQPEKHLYLIPKVYSTSGQTPEGRPGSLTSVSDRNGDSQQADSGWGIPDKHRFHSMPVHKTHVQCIQ